MMKNVKIFNESVTVSNVLGSTCKQQGMVVSLESFFYTRLLPFYLSLSLSSSITRILFVFLSLSLSLSPFLWLFLNFPHFFCVPLYLSLPLSVCFLPLFLSPLFHLFTSNLFACFLFPSLSLHIPLSSYLFLFDHSLSLSFTRSFSSHLYRKIFFFFIIRNRRYLIRNSMEYRVH